MKKIPICVLFLLFHFQQVFSQQLADFEWETSRWAEGASITRYVGTSTDVVIPEAINGVPVVDIGNEAFYGMQLTSIAIPGSVSLIGAYAFRSNLLTSVTIPESVLYIANGAFIDNQLTSITFPANIRWVSGDTFTGNPITSITVEGEVAFYPIGSGSIGIFGYDDDCSFEKAYYRAGKLPGTYTRPNAESTEWTRQ